MIIGYTRRADAAPYSIFLQYSVDHETDPAKKTIKVPVVVSDDLNAVDMDAPFFASTFGTHLDGIFIQLDKLSKDALTHVRNIVVVAKCDGCVEKVTNIPSSDFDAHVVMGASDLGANSVTNLVSLEIVTKPQASFLCDVELGLREKGAHDQVTSGPLDLFATTSTSEKKPVEAFPAEVFMGDTSWATKHMATALLLDRALKVTSGPDAGQPILFSFCSSIGSSFDWDAMARNANIAKLTGTHDGPTLRDHEKRLLQSAILPALKTQTSLGELSLKADQPGFPIDVVATRHRAIRLINGVFGTANGSNSKGANTSVFNENGRSLSGGAENEIDQASTVGIDPGVFAVDGTLILSTSIVYIDYDDTSKNHVHAKVDVDEAYRLKKDFHDLLGQSATLGLYVKVGTKETLITSPTIVTVRNIGIVASFPIISEIVAAATKNTVKAADLVGQSSIPISWAIPLGGGASQVAVTFPFMFGINPRGASTLADYIRIFAAVSFILPAPGDSGNAQAAFGGGIALFKAFDFSFAATVGATPHAYFLIGLSATDLIKAFMPGK